MSRCRPAGSLALPIPNIERVFKCSDIQATVQVRCKAGVVRGRVIPSVHEETGVAEFLGIPFALPPVKDLRYADPVYMDKLPQGQQPALFHRSFYISTDSPDE